MTRRRGIRNLAGCVLGGWMAGALNAKQPDIRFPTAARDRLAIASYPFRAFIRKSMPLVAFPAMVVERFDIRNVELLGDHFASTEPDYVRRLRDAVEKAGVRVVNLPVGSRASAYDPDPEKRANALAEGSRWVDTAAALNCPSIRVHVRGVAGAPPDVGFASETLFALASYGEEKKVVINLENDDPKSEQAAFLVKVIERVNHGYLRALPDFCNSMLIGPEQYNYDSVKAMFAHAYNICHVKDSEVDGGKVYRVDVDRTFAIAKASGYRGYFSMEWEAAGDPYAGTQKLIEMSLRNLAG